MKILERLNGTTKLILSIVAIIVLAWQFDGHYAKASEVAAIQHSTSTILDVLKMQYISRKAVLETLKEQGRLKPEQAVELKGLISILATLEKRGQ